MYVTSAGGEKTELSVGQWRDGTSAAFETIIIDEIHCAVPQWRTASNRT